MCNQTGKSLWEQAIEDSIQAVEKTNEQKHEATLKEQNRVRKNRAKAESVTRELEAFLASAEWVTAQRLLCIAQQKDHEIDNIQIVSAEFELDDCRKLPIKEYVYLTSYGLSKPPKETVEKILAVDEARPNISRSQRSKCLCKMIVTGDNLEELVQVIRENIDRIARWILIL